MQGTGRRFRSTIVLGVAVLLAQALALCPASLGVEQTGDITGTVRDEKGSGLPGATITLTVAKRRPQRRGSRGKSA